MRWAAVAAAAIALLWASPLTISTATSVFAAAVRPIQEREAFTWQESFEDGLTRWMFPSALASAEAGIVRVRGLTLLKQTMSLKNYGVDFSARSEKKSIGWVVSAADPGNYSVFKLVERGRTAKGIRYDLVRYAVVGGASPEPSERETVPVIVVSPVDGFLDISVRVTEEQILTLVNGFGVDTWKRSKVKPGGIGFLAENGESFLVKSLTVTGNEDSLGLFLWGAEQTFRSIRSWFPQRLPNARG